MHTYRTIEHTADIGMEVEANTLPELFEGAAYAMSSMMADPAGSVDEVEREVGLEAADLVELMFLWLNELLFLAESGGLVLSGFDVAVEGTGLRAVCRGEPLDPGKHSMKSEIKAATYHELLVERSGERGWKARVIFDV